MKTIKTFSLVETWGKLNISLSKASNIWKHTKTIDSNRENIFKSSDPQKNMMVL